MGEETFGGNDPEVKKMAEEFNAEQERAVESEIDFEMYEKSLRDGTADEYLEMVGALPAEALLEEQEDERVWSQLSEEERDKIYKLLKSYADENGYSIEMDDEVCMVTPS